MADTSYVLENCHPRHLTKKEIILVRYAKKTAPNQNSCITSLKKLLLSECLTQTFIYK